MSYTVREIELRDNAGVESVIRTCLIEFGANHEGTAWADPDLGRFSEVYSAPGKKYWVAVDEDGRVIAGAGIGNIDGVPRVCELQKMYCLPEARGTGISHVLMDLALEYAKEHYDECYLETLDNMLAAHRFYEKYGFARIYEPIGKTGHFLCDVLYLKKL